MCFVGGWEVITPWRWPIYIPSATYRLRGRYVSNRYVAPPEVVCSAPTDMYHPGPIHNTGRYVAGFALHTETATYRAQTRYIGGAAFLTQGFFKERRVWC